MGEKSEPPVAATSSARTATNFARGAFTLGAFAVLVGGLGALIAVCGLSIAVSSVIALLLLVNGPAPLSTAWWLLLALNLFGLSSYFTRAASRAS